jgi:hypothetical protein
MTREPPTVQEEAQERAAQELARRVAAVTALRDPLAWARTFIRDMTAAGNWRYVPPALVVALARREGVPPDAHATELAAVREACETASDKIHRKDNRDD